MRLNIYNLTEYRWEETKYKGEKLNAKKMIEYE